MTVIHDNLLVVRKKNGTKNIPRKRKYVNEIFQSLGAKNVRKSYRMEE